MAFIVNKGTRANPSLSARYKDALGKWVQTKVPAEHAVTRKAAQRWADQQQEAVDEGKPDPRKPRLCGPLLEDWIKSLDNRSKDEDECRVRKYLVPRFAALPIRRLTKSEVIRWLDELGQVTFKPTKKSEPKPLSGGSRKKLFTLLSRFLSWASARDYIDGNPCRDVPTTERPQEDGKRSRPWLADEEKVRAMMFALGPAYGLMFATARAGGLRLCEVAGLRISDTNALAGEGVLRVRYSYDTPMLKEDKGRGVERKQKWSPIHDPTIAASLLALAARRRGGGDRLPADEEARLFDHLAAKPNATRVACSRAWRDAAATVKGGIDGLSWYESSRHSFASKALSMGARYEEVSKALGHASVSTAARYYDRHVERKFASLPATDIGAPLPDALVLPFPSKQTA